MDGYFSRGKSLEVVINVINGKSYLGTRGLVHDIHGVGWGYPSRSPGPFGRCPTARLRHPARGL